MAQVYVVASAKVEVKVEVKGSAKIFVICGK
jgi:hypothetical protein